MKIICFPHFYYLSEVSRLVEIGKALRILGQDVLFFSHGGSYEHVAQEADFEGRVLLAPHVPAHRVNSLADIAITHGGAGTVQPAIHAGTPLVGIPMHLEQTGNLSLVTRQGAGLMLSKWDLNRRSLGRALERLLTDVSLRENMLRLKALQDKVDGPANAAGEIVKFLGASA
ncbi:MAG: hypothetical protein JXA21_12495 [Anaerolineae bacterium]|nr:hypothetical protein [Anaerolineae bacterium]